jgi:hypothetical protein
MQVPHKAIAINQNIGAHVPQTELVNEKQTPILYPTQEEAQAAANIFATEIENKTGIPGWIGFIEGVFPPDFSSEVRPPI